MNTLKKSLRSSLIIVYFFIFLFFMNEATYAYYKININAKNTNGESLCNVKLYAHISSDKHKETLVSCKDPYYKYGDCKRDTYVGVTTLVGTPYENYTIKDVACIPGPGRDPASVSKLFNTQGYIAGCVFYSKGDGGCGNGSDCSTNIILSMLSPTPTLPPLPSSTPTPLPPSPTPPPPSPTSIQPTVVITLPQPKAETFSDDKKSKLGQSWVCIESIPCSKEGISCSGGNPQHRVRIQTKEGASLKMTNTPTYVFECLSTDQKSYRCTTGNDNLDRTLISKSNLSGLKKDYGYSFVSYTTTQNISINQTIPANVPKTGDNGTFGPYEWESKTDVQAWRLIMTMQDLDYQSTAEEGSVGALQQATFSFSFNEDNHECVIIKWDPQGIIYDIATLLPIEGVKVTLYVKNENGTFVPMQDTKWGLLANPVYSTTKGAYQFFVPAGTYRLEVSKAGYELVTDQNTISKVKTIRNLYDGVEFVTKGEIREVNMLMRKKTGIESFITAVQSLFPHK